jgi:tRNA pseudouridine38-40 synthase
LQKKIKFKDYENDNYKSKHSFCRLIIMVFNCSFEHMKYKYFYVVTIQFLGFRFHGWQKQTNAKTVHEMVDKSLNFVFCHSNFKTLGSSRTDAKVSANRYVFELFINEELEKLSFLSSLNSNFPNDIKALSVTQVNKSFNIIQHPKLKEYLYLFSYGKKIQPFAAPILVGIEENLDIELMKIGAKLFEGEHYFHKYCTKPSAKTIFKREIVCCEIELNTIYSASFFPEKSYLLRVKGKGFLRYQIRFMMGVLFQLGKNEITLDYIEKSIDKNNDREPLKIVAPSSGLQLYDIEFIQ